MKVKLARDLLKANDVLAGGLRDRLGELGLLAVNLIGSPGSGKTTLLERTIGGLGARRVAVVEGDVATTLDAQRIERTGAAVVQVNTDGACHLDANMVTDAVTDLALEGVDYLFIENVGNLVCPAAWDLGEDLKVVVSSVAEGDEKPAKYPRVFREAQACVLNKTDLIPHVEFDAQRFTTEVRRLNPEAEVFLLSAREGSGIDKWLTWLETRLAAKRATR
ncbi:MAG: hydrogenase nickel incorporation protein HypB [Actinomycetia bacterium]|nr:hydrogenase nickel incorporation protein HypB [Actinomycetes bacterium]